MGRESKFKNSLSDSKLQVSDPCSRESLARLQLVLVKVQGGERVAGGKEGGGDWKWRERIPSGKASPALGCLVKLPTRNRGPREARDRTFLSWTGLALQAGSGHQQEHQPLLIEKQPWHLAGAMPGRDQGSL